MKRSFGIALLASGLFLASCGDSADSVSSTPIDSTTLNGTAPAEYKADDPANPNSPRYQGAADTGVRPNNGTSADSNTDRLP